VSEQPQTIELLAGQRQDRESDAAVVACNDYLHQGPGRSLAKLIQKYTESDQESPPTTNLGVIKRWSAAYDWQGRASTYDAEVEQQKAAEIRRLRTEGLAADHNRIAELAEIFDALKQDFLSSGLYRTDIKLSATGKEVEVEVFNKPLIDSMRGILDDIAKEVGGRKQQINQTILDLSNATDEQLERIANGEDPARVMGRV
jgi:hypothetical protein